jgi:hypothetical protein
MTSLCTQPRVSGTIPHISTSALEFEGLSFVAADGSIRVSNITQQQLQALEDYLKEHYGARDFFYCEPFFVIGCDEDRLPSEDQRPFTVAGMIAVWRTVGNIFFRAIVGHDSEEGPVIEIDPEIIAEMAPLKIFSDKVVLYLADHVFLDCEAISIFWDVIVVELPKMGPEEFSSRLQTLPRHIKGCPFAVRYYNGPMPNSERREREVKPTPKFIDSICDETDYVTLDKKFYPGTMLCSTDPSNNKAVSSVTAGILVKKGSEKRITCSFHNWEQQYEKYTDQFGQTDQESQRIFRVIQGTNPGTDVGFVRDRIGNTDIALAQLHESIVFENSFMEMAYTPKKFIHSDQQRMGDRYLIDSFTTGKQSLWSYGRRRAVRRRNGELRHGILIPKGMEHLGPSPTVSYIVLDQNVCVTNSPVFTTKPFIRDGVCGAVLLRQHDFSKRHESQATVMERGEISAMMHFADIQQIDSASCAESYFIYADSFDPLIDAGWEIDSQEEIVSLTDVEADESPRKKQRAE